MSKSSSSPNAVPDAVPAVHQPVFTVIENVKGERIPLTCPDYVDDASINLSENSIKVLEKRYLRRDFDGSFLETPAGMFYRVAYHIAQVEKQHGCDSEAVARVFYDLLSERRFFPNSPTFTGAGTPLGQLAACFVLAIEDDMGKESDGIFSTLRVAALIQQTGGGNGFSFSRLRPKGDIVLTSSGRATGPVGFLRVYDQAFGEIAQGGSRRGANMGVLRVDHPDIEEFIRCKAEEGKIANFNISVAITDAFMQAVKDDTDFDLVNPRNGKVQKTVRARDLFAEIVKYAHHNGEPGALFIDAANRTNPVPHLYDLEATNPCVTGDTLVYTAEGMRRAADLYASQEALQVVLDGRFGAEARTSPASPVFYTGRKPVFRLDTAEGYRLDATGNHRVMTARGWVAVEDLQPGDKLHILNRKGGFGTSGSLALGRTVGWLLGDGTLHTGEGVGLMCFGAEREPAPQFAEYVENLAGADVHHNPFVPNRSCPIGVTQVADRNEAHVVSTRLRSKLAELGVTEQHAVPELVFTGSEAMQRGFLQGLFSADGTVLDNGAKGVSIRLWSAAEALLRGVQQLLLNFGIVSHIHWNRKLAGYKFMPDGRGGKRAYVTAAGHELVVSQANLATFAQEIGFLQEARAEKLAASLASYGARGLYREYFVATVKSVTALGVQPVYDLTEPLTHSFVANGLVVHNCGEQWLGPYENCCLGSINLAGHVTTNANGAAVVDWKLLRRSVDESTHFLDNVVTANAYVPAVPKVAQAAYQARRIGLGIMGLGDMMYKLGIRYGSEEGQEFAAQVMEFVRYHSMRKSVELAEERGAFLAFDNSIYDPKSAGGMKWQPPVALRPFERNWQRPVLDWDAVVAGIKAHGIRNAAQTTVAPTGTIATVVGCEGYGCEPVFALGYIRHFKDGDRDVELYYTSPLFEQALNAADLSAAEKAHIKQHVATFGTCQDMEDLPEHLRHAFVVSSDISADEHVMMQAAIQAFTDNSISKCVVGDTLVLTGQGLAAIEDLSALRMPDQFEVLDLAVVSPSGVERTNAYYCGGYRETRKVNLSYGFAIEGTPNHRIQVLDVDGAVQFRRLDELKVGDVAVLYGNQQKYGPAGQALPAHTGQFRTNSCPAKFPAQMSEELAFLLGCLTSAGSIGRNGIQLTSTDVARLEQLKGIGHRLFGLDGSIVKDNRNSVHSLQINSRALRNWLLAELGLEAGAENQIIPACILRAAHAEVSAFLCGLTLDGFMTDNGRTFGITLASSRLIAQLQVLLLNMGVLSTTRRVAERAWNLTVQGGELEMLADQISFVAVWKNERIARRNTGRMMQMRNDNRLLPETVTTAPRAMQTTSDRSLQSVFAAAAEEQSAYQRARVNLLQGHGLERGDANRLFQALQQPGEQTHATAFFGRERSDQIYVEVQSVAAGFAEVFDLSVPGSHTFIANGLGNHNTCNFPEGATEEDVAKAYMLAWETGCKGLTVYVTGSRQVVVLETKATREKKEEPTLNGSSAGKEVDHGYRSVQIDVRPTMVKRPRPAKLHGATYRKETPMGTAYVTVNSDERNEPFEVFMNVGKAGTEVTAVSEAMGRLISLILRMPASLPPTERLRWIKEEMAGIGGGRPLGFGINRVRSLPDGVAQVLAEHLSELPAVSEELQAEQLALPIDTKPVGDICPDCGEASFLNVEGCRKCYVCGFSEC